MESKIQKSLIETNIKDISYLGKNAVYNFINIMIEINFVIEMNIAVKKLFDKELVMTKEDDKDF